MRIFSNDIYRFESDLDMLSVESVSNTQNVPVKAFTHADAPVTADNAAELSLAGMLQQSYHGPGFAEGAEDAGVSLSSDVVDVKDLSEDMAACCACVSCASLVEGSAGYEIPTLDVSAEMGSSLTFTLTDTGGVGVGTDAETGFLAATALWISFLADAVNVDLDVGFSSLDPGVLGQAGSRTAIVTYEVLRDALIADGTSADDASAYANLQATADFDFATQDSTGAFILDDNNSNNNNFMSVNTATLKALGITNDFFGNLIDDGSADASITFNSDFTFDFDPTDGIDPGAIDFVGVAFHEIGHALGFVSGVDAVDQNASTDLNGFVIFGALDLFRYSVNAQTLFGAGTLDLGYGGDTFFSIDGGTTNLGRFSTGVVNGDGRQASHWKDNLGLGIMDPTSAPAGTANVITELDIRAFDVIGWDRLVDPDTAVTLLDASDVLVNQFATIQEAEDAGFDDYSIEVNAAAYGANPEAVTTDLDNLTFTLGAGVTPTITMTGAAADLTLEGLGAANVRGNALGNTITGNDGDNIINAQDGADILNGGLGNDSLRGQGDDDVVNGGEGNDTLLGGLGTDLMNGNEDDDFMNGQGGDDIMNGGDGSDTMLGASGDDVMIGGDGNDDINGNGGADDIDGGEGDDALNGAVGEDTVAGGNGDDTISGGNQNDTLSGDAGNDTLNGDAGNDIVNGGADNDILIGASGQDTLNGDAGNDNLSGDSGGDDLFGGAGDDILNGGGDNDNLNGGTGADVFVANLGFRTDRIQDFEDGIDQIDFSNNVLANDIADVLAAAAQVGANVRIDLNANNALIIENFDLADLDASDFIF